jgi:hypothetical protein
LFIASDKSTQSEQDVRGQEDQEAADQEFWPIHSSLRRQACASAKLACLYRKYF